MADSGHEGGTVGWIGAGKMGRPMARHLLDAGYGLCISDPVQENRATLVARGARVAESVTDLGIDCDVVFSTIPNDAVLDAVIFGEEGVPGLLDGSKRPKVFVEMSTVSPEASARVADRLCAAGVAYLRAPVSGSTDTAAAGKLTVLASGDEEAWRIARPMLEAFSARQFLLGPGEEARYMKLVVNTLVGGLSAIVSEAVVLGEAGGLDRRQIMEVLSESAVASPIIAYKRDAIERDDFTPAFSVIQMVKDFIMICNAGNHAGIPMLTTSLILQQYHAAAASGDGEKDFFVLTQWLRTLSGRSVDDPSIDTGTAHTGSISDGAQAQSPVGS